MKLRTDNRFKGLKVSRHKMKYEGCQYVRYSKGNNIRKLTQAEIEEFRQRMQQIITGDVPRAKPL